MTHALDLRGSIAAYMRTLSDWRRRRYDDDLRDQRNLRSADALLDLAAFVQELSIDDARLAALVRLASDGETFAPGQQTVYELGRFHFHDETITYDGFLTLLISLAERDAGESGRFGGRQAQGDDPWR